MEHFCDAGEQPQARGQATGALGSPCPSPPARSVMRAAPWGKASSFQRGRTAKVNADRATQQKAPRGQAPKNMLEGAAQWPGLRCKARPRVSNGEVLVISSDLCSIIFAGNVRTAFTNNVWNHFQLFAFQVSLLRSGDISRLTGVPLEGRFNMWLKAFVAGAVGGFLFKLLWLVTCVSSLRAVGFCY